MANADSSMRKVLNLADSNTFTRGVDAHIEAEIACDNLDIEVRKLEYRKEEMKAWREKLRDLQKDKNLPLPDIPEKKRDRHLSLMLIQAEKDLEEIREELKKTDALYEEAREKCKERRKAMESKTRKFEFSDALSRCKEMVERGKEEL